MRIHNQAPLLALTILLASATIGAGPADKYSGTPQARAAFADGEKLQKARDFAAAADAYKRAMTLDPNFASACEKYFYAKKQAFSEKVDDKPEAEQEKGWKEFDDQSDAEMDELMKRKPPNPVWPWINSTRYEEDAPEKRRELCQQALSLDSHFLPGYSCLAQLAELEGDIEQAARLMHRVLDSHPQDIESWLSLIHLVRSDPALLAKSVDEIEHRFPHSETAARARYLLALSKSQPPDQTELLKKLIADYSPAKFNIAAEAAMQLFNLEDASDPSAARDLAHARLKDARKAENWKAAVVYADTMASAQRQIDGGKASEALELLKTVKTDELPVGSHRLDNLRANALAASGDVAGAYQSTLQTFAKAPNEQSGATLYAIGEKFGKSRNQVDIEVRSARAGRAEPAKPFSLQDFAGHRVSLEDFKGRVVFLDFWFPNCQPCRDSFPHLRALIDRYKGNKDVVFLGVNALAGQEPFVMPLLRKEGINWTPLKGNLEWCSEVYGVSVFPTTFLIGRDGKKYFKPDLRTFAGKRSAELAIEALRAMQ